MRLGGICALLLLVSVTVGAQTVPSIVTYQGKLTDSTGAPLADGQYQMELKLYSTYYGGMPFVTSGVVNVQTKGGLFTTELAPLTPALLAGKTDVWLETCVGDPGVALSPRARLCSVPFALRAGSLDLPFAGTAGGGSAVFSVTNTGANSAGVFATNNTSNGASAALEVTTNGTGRAGSFAQNNSLAGTEAVLVSASGIGPALLAQAKSTGPAIRTSGAYAGDFEGKVYVNGKLGVGNSNPTQKLQVDSGDAMIRGTANFVKNDDAAVLYLGDTNNYVKATYGVVVTVGTSGTTDALTVQNGGNVGVGVTPSSKLTVAGTIESTSGGVKFPDGTTQLTAAACVPSGWTEYNSGGSYSFTVPAGVTRIMVELWGAGGGGAAYGGSGSCGGGGGGGSYARASFNVVAGQAQSIAVGSGSSSAGGASTFTSASGSAVSANGGAAGSGTSGGAGGSGGAGTALRRSGKGGAGGGATAGEGGRAPYGTVEPVGGSGGRGGYFMGSPTNGQAGCCLIMW